MSHLAVAPAEAIGFLSFLIAWHGGVIPVYLDGKPLAAAHIRGRSVSDLGDQLAARAAVGYARQCAGRDRAARTLAA